MSFSLHDSVCCSILCTMSAWPNSESWESTIFLLPEGQYPQQQQPNKAHGLPVPCGGVHGDLAEVDALDPAQRAQAEDESRDADEQVGGVQAGEEIEEGSGRGGKLVEGKASRRKLPPGHPLSGEKERAQRERCPQPGKGAIQRWPAHAQPLLQRVDLMEDIPPRQLHGQATEQQHDPGT